jgi:undecaprenyl-diphosphatase
MYMLAAWLIQILIESLPLSSSGHVTLLCKALHKAPLFSSSWYAGAQAVSILLTLLYTRRWWLRWLKGGLLSPRRLVKPGIIGALALLPSIALYLLLHTRELGQLLPFGFAITTLLLASSYWLLKVSYRSHWPLVVLSMGIVQALALLPGISRFGITYTTARFLGFRHERAFTWSLWLVVPLSMAAFLKELPAVWYNGSRGCIALLDLGLIVLASIISYQLLALADKLGKRNSWWLFSFWTAVCVSLAWYWLPR